MQTNLGEHISQGTEGEESMKKKLSLILVIIMALVLITACGQSGGTENGDTQSGFEPDTLKIMGDIFPYVGEENWQDGYSETTYTIVFDVDGVYYRAKCEMPEDISAKVWGVDFEDEERDQKIRDLVSPLEIASFENLSEQITPQEELDKLVGKTGQELFDDGWTYWSYNLEDMEAGMNYGPFTYRVVFEYEGEPMENTDDFDFYEEFKDLAVASVTYEGLGDAIESE